MVFTTNMEENCRALSDELRLSDSLDLKEGEVLLAGKRCVFYYVDGFLDKQALERIFLGTHGLSDSVWQDFNSPLLFARKFLPFADCVETAVPDDAIQKLLAGYTLLFFDGFACVLIAEVRKVPQRSIQEPDRGKTLRGAHEGYCENITTNLALLRRRIQTPRFHADKFVFGNETRTRVALCYVEGKVNPKYLKILRDKLQKLQLNTLSMGEESLTEALFYHRGVSLCNPLPRARFTERPDTCAAVLAEGQIVLLCDNTPSAIILPMSIFDFFEECGDYYFPPLTATYLRLVRFFFFIISVFLVPLWLLAVQLELHLSETLAFILVTGEYAVPLFWQLIIIEIAVDGLKLASLNTPDPLSNSLSVVGGLLLGDFAVQSGWFVPQTILYSALSALTSFVPNNYELGYSFKFARILLLCGIHLFGLWGFVGGTAFLILTLGLTRTVAGSSYLYPFIPFSARGILKLFVRTLHGKE